MRELTGPPMVGRTGELERIRAAWKEVGAGPRVVVVTGDEGSGKSRLAAEALHALEPAAVLAGRARTRGPAPYDWLASALDGQDLSGLAVSPDALAWLTQRPDIPANRFEPGSLLRLATHIVRARLGAGPGVLLVEDLHDLDPASLTLVADLASAQSLPALILVTTRPCRSALAARVLARLAGTRIHLGPLEPTHVAELCQLALGTPVSSDLADRVHRRVGGSPRWLAELLAVVQAGELATLDASPLPPYLVALATGALPAGAVDVARAAALLADDVTVARLTDLCGPGAEAAVRTLLEAGVVDLSPDGDPVFRHPLVAEALAQNAMPSVRLSVRDQLGPSDLNLTAREREVLACLTEGMTNQQVASALGISVRTVAVHVSNLLRKTGSASRTEAALWGVQRGVGVR